MDIAATHSLPWIVVGDFKEIITSHEKFSATPANQSRMASFNACINDSNLMNLGFHGTRFTWISKHNNGIVMERFNRFLCNPVWKTCFEETTILHLPRVYSDHNPILPDTDPIQLSFGRKPFCLETMWFNDIS